MIRNWKIAVGVLAAGVVLLSIFKTSISLSTLLVQPVRALLGTPQQLQSGVLEVSENIPVVKEATRRLLKPLGGVRLIRRFPATPSPDTTSAPPAPSN